MCIRQKSWCCYLCAVVIAIFGAVMAGRITMARWSGITSTSERNVSIQDEGMSKQFGGPISFPDTIESPKVDRLNLAKCLDSDDQHTKKQAVEQIRHLA